MLNSTRFGFSASLALTHYQIILLLLINLTSFVRAQTSLYIPGFDPQPVSADVIGVGSGGRTTWALHKGEATNNAENPEFIGTATLVQGPHDVSLTYANSAASFTIGQACTLLEELAICTIVAAGSTAVQTEVASAVPVQVGPASGSGNTNSVVITPLPVGSSTRIPTLSTSAASPVSELSPTQSRTEVTAESTLASSAIPNSSVRQSAFYYTAAISVSLLSLLRSFAI
ncbi:hypothetical protein BDQ12DRAFT_633921 [Crucibulum laeve]|uniref:Uncharacterized protein n=1 Tax=Crucibulum laeve TaxID=68775 RepID=A0A5C3M5E4_9AGAR|nr:hypothetical protein BDQ12DRAFT_633921 [Crucibulum laeve]